VVGGGGGGRECLGVCRTSQEVKSGGFKDKGQKGEHTLQSWKNISKDKLARIGVVGVAKSGPLGGLGLDT